MYKLSKKLVVIAPKSSSNILRGLIPAAIVSFVGAFILRSYFSMKTSFIQRAQFETEKIITAVEDGAAAGSAETVSGAAQTAYAAASNYWLFFLLGALFALVIYLILNWRKFK